MLILPMWDMDLPLEASSAPAEAASFSERDVPEFQSEDVEMEVEQPQTIPMIDVCLCSERVRIGCLTSPDLLSEERFSVESISFSGGAHDSEVVELCGSKVRLWKPTGAVSDTTLEELDPQGTFLAMVKELKGIDSCECRSYHEGEGSLAVLQEAQHQSYLLQVGYEQ